MVPIKKSSEIVAEARKSFDNGLTRDMAHRINSLKSFVKFLEENEEEIIDAIIQDVRKHREEARLEIIIAINHVRFLIDNVKNWMIPEKPSRRLVDLFDELFVYHDPYGVVLVLGTWNVPLLTLLPALGALAVGNCVVIKPSHNVPNFGKFLAETLPKYLHPIYYPVCLGGADETMKLLEEKFDYIYYTGSVAFGKTVHLAANKYLTPTTLEMGGKNPTYIDASVDMETAARRIIWGKYYTSGQICIAPDYILCTKSVEKEFIKYAKIMLKQFNYDNAKSCPIVNKHHFLRLQNLITGLKIAVGGRVDIENNSIEPTIAIDVDPDHPIMKEEIFGPILPIITVENVKEAVRFINQNEKPLALYVFTNDKSTQNYIIDNTSSGGVTVNDTIMHLLVENLPFGGVGNSGMGCYKGTDSFRTFTHRKSVLVKNSWRILEKLNELRYPLLSSRKSNITAFLLQYRQGLPWGWVVHLGTFLLGIIVGCVIFYCFI